MRFTRWHHPSWGWTTKPETRETKAIEAELAEGAFALSHLDVAVPMVGHVWVDDNAIVAFKPAGKERIEGRILERSEYEAIGCNPFEVAENELGMEPVEARPDEGSRAGSRQVSNGGYLQAARWHFERLPPRERSKPYLSALPPALREEDYPHARFGQERKRADRASPPPKGVASGRQWSPDKEEALRREFPSEADTTSMNTEARQGQVGVKGDDVRERSETGGGGEMNADTGIKDTRQRKEEGARTGASWSNRPVRTGAIIAAGVAVTVAVSIGITWPAFRDDIESMERAVATATEAAERARESANDAKELTQTLNEERLEILLTKTAAKAVDRQLKAKLAKMLGTEISDGDTVAVLAERLTRKLAEEVAVPVIDNRIRERAGPIVEEQLREQLRKMVDEPSRDEDTVAVLVKKLVEKWTGEVVGKVTKMLKDSASKVVPR